VAADDLAHRALERVGAQLAAQTDHHRHVQRRVVGLAPGDRQDARLCRRHRQRAAARHRRDRLERSLRLELAAAQALLDARGQARDGRRLEQVGQRDLDREPLA
jgi:hypothetical protein